MRRWVNFFKRKGMVVVVVLFGLYSTSSAGGPNTSKEENVIRFSRFAGALAGTSMGVFVLSLEITGHNEVKGGIATDLEVSLPSIIVGAYVGRAITEWSTRQIMKGSPKPAKAALKGVLYGTISGAVIGASTMVPILVIGHLTDGITFNDDFSVFKVAGIAAFGGAVFGGMIGAGVGAAYGPAISFYMNF